MEFSFFGKNRSFPVLSSCSLLVLSMALQTNHVKAQANYFDPQAVPTTFDGSIGGRVWLDMNGDGIQNQGEESLRGIKGAPMRIFDQYGEEVTRMFSDIDGTYQFNDLPYGYYKVQFAKSRRCNFTRPDANNNSNDTKDSDAALSNGVSQWIELSPANTTDFSIDVGYYCGASQPQNTTQAFDDKATTTIGEFLVVDVLKNDRIYAPATLTILDSTVPGFVSVSQSRIVIADTQDIGEYVVRYRVDTEDGGGSEAELIVTIEPQILPDISSLLSSSPRYSAQPPVSISPRPISVPTTPRPTRTYTPSPKPAPIVSTGPNFSSKRTVANNDSVKGRIGETLRVNILSNDQLSDLVDVVRVIYTDIPGSVRVVNNRLIIEDTDKVGAYTVTYELVSRDGKSDIAQVAVILDTAPQETIARDDAAEGLMGESLLVDLLSNDVPSEDIYDVEILDDNVPGNVYITDNYDLAIENTRTAGDFYVTYGLESTSGSRGVATVTVKLIDPDSLIPTIARDDRVSGQVGERLVVDILTNDSASKSIAQVNLLESNVQGSVSLDEENRLVIDANTRDNDPGVFVVVYELVSTSGSRDTAQVIVSLSALPAPPPREVILDGTNDTIRIK